MRLYEETGQHSAAMRQFEACEKVLDEELGLRPDAETLSLFERIKSGAFNRRKPPPREKQVKTSPARKQPQPQAGRPSGTVTFLFSDIEGSTQLWERYPAGDENCLHPPGDDYPRGHGKLRVVTSIK